MVCKLSDVWDEMDSADCSYVPRDGEEWIYTLYSGNSRLWEVRGLEYAHLGKVLPGARECETKTMKEIVEESAYMRSLDEEREAILRRQGVEVSWLEPDQPEPKVKKEKGPKCAYVIRRGAKEGSTCSRYALADSDMCRIHGAVPKGTRRCLVRLSKGGLCSGLAAPQSLVCSRHTESQGEESVRDSLEVLERQRGLMQPEPL